MIGVSVAKIDNDEGNINVYHDNSNDKKVNNGAYNVQNFSKKEQMNDFLGSGPEGVDEIAIFSKFRPSVPHTWAPLAQAFQGLTQASQVPAWVSQGLF